MVISLHWFHGKSQPTENKPSLKWPVVTWPVQATNLPQTKHAVQFFLTGSCDQWFNVNLLMHACMSVVYRKWNVTATFISFVLRRRIHVHWLWIRCCKWCLWRSWYVTPVVIVVIFTVCHSKLVVNIYCLYSWLLLWCILSVHGTDVVIATACSSVL